MKNITMTIESENEHELRTVTREVRHMFKKLNRKSDEAIGYVILTVNKETGKSRKIVSRSLA